eukprot:CAMPEP_0175259400 /NCGR_PEP_ID=MMETSP0093-20121207/39717_1 /TAXON_ID=311494 /ORGANISM="Alexandrium monilatum, Strain CCMP3105" /LENGTH=62 /DNA_ID=CAMNT_0016553811 /DNA_START=79 /DNA_END=267 /DNA_ORIENTATION=+
MASTVACVSRSTRRPWAMGEYRPWMRLSRSKSSSPSELVNSAFMGLSCRSSSTLTGAVSFGR